MAQMRTHFLVQAPGRKAFIACKNELYEIGNGPRWKSTLDPDDVTCNNCRRSLLFKTRPDVKQHSCCAGGAAVQHDATGDAEK